VSETNAFSLFGLQVRSKAAADEFSKHGLSDVVLAGHRDVCSDGFGLDSVADAVFLDLPKPWEAIPHAKAALKRARGGRLCSFSPCVEQVQRAAAAMRAQGFKEIRTAECLLREFQVRRVSLPVYDPERQSVTDATRTRKRKAEDCDGDGNGDDDAQWKEENGRPKDPQASFVTGLPLMQMPGHTGYLTFATLPARPE